MERIDPDNGNVPEAVIPEDKCLYFQPDEMLELRNFYKREGRDAPFESLQDYAPESYDEDWWALLDHLYSCTAIDMIVAATAAASDPVINRDALVARLLNELPYSLDDYDIIAPQELIDDVLDDNFTDWVGIRNKFRKDLTVQMLSELSVYLKAHDKYFYLACLMEYYAFIRPNELSHLKVGCVQVKSQIIRLPPEITKNGKDGNVVLNKKIILLMLDLDILNKPGDFYIFSHGCMPGKEYVGPDQFNKKWKTIRMALGWSSRYQFYSLKDSGIRDLANTEGIAVTRDQARHMDISTTNRYIQRHAVHECVKGFEGNL